MTFKINNSNFYLNGRRVFLNSGEIHYFRLRKELWGRHLAAAKEAGLMAVSTYVPWAWHEENEGVFDFDGSTRPELDLREWLRLCKEHGLYCILKPGPFILAETRGAGIPRWFLDRFGEEARMRNRTGGIVPSDGLNLFHPKFMEKVTAWYDRIMPLIGEHEVRNGGPVIMMQVCNEIGVFSWLAHQADYGMGVKSKFANYLRRKFGNIQEVNRLWGTDYQHFDDIELPPDGRLPYQSRQDRARDFEWHRFWRAYYADYLERLAGMARDRGVTVPFYHNLPGWIYGHGHEFPVNITMYDELFGDKSDILFGVDHIPEFLSHRNMHDDRIINDITTAMQGEKPLFAAEFQCGSREYHVVTNPRELELFYKASIAHGLVGWNHYMFSQGRNPRQKGYSGDTFYWFTPLTAGGEKTSSFPLVKRMSGMLEVCENIILQARRRAEVCVLFYPHYYATELERPEEGASGLKFDYAAIRRPAYFDGLLKALQVLDVEYDMADLCQASAESLGRYTQVWAFSTDEMNARNQQVLVDYARNGGQLVIFPYLPDREMSQWPCTILRDALSSYPVGTETIDSPLIDIFDLKDIKCANPQVIYDEGSLADADIVARTIKGSACGFEKHHGKGSVLHLGTWLGFDTESHKQAYEAMLHSAGAKLRNASSTSGFVNVRQRFTEDGKGLLFIGNYYNEEQRARVEYTHPAGGEKITVPYDGSEISWPPLYGVLTPLCLEIGEGLRILHTTSDILNIKKIENGIELTLSGDRDLAGEMVLEGEQVVKSAAVDGNEMKITWDDNRTVIHYPHGHGKEIYLMLSLVRQGS